MTTAPPPTVRSAVARRRTGLVASAALSVVAATAGLAPYVAVHLVAVELFGGREPDGRYLGTIAAGTAAALVLRAVCSGLSTHLAHVAAHAALADLRRGLVERLARIPLGRVQARSAGELKKIVHDDVEQMEDALAHGVPDIAAAAAVPLATTALLFAVDPRFAQVAVAALLVVVVIGAVASRLASRDGGEQMAALVGLTTAVLTHLRGMAVLRSFRRDGPDAGVDQLRDALSRSLRAGDAPLRSPARWLVSAMTAAMGLGIAFLLPTVGLAFVDGSASLATLTLFLLLGLGYATPLFALLGTLVTLSYRIRLASASITGLLAEPELPVPTEPRVPESFGITFTDVTFGYTADRPVVHGITLDVPAGRVTALVGATGAGKSTLARLVARFWDVTEGSVRIGGVDVRDVDPAVLMRSIALVQQDDHVFDDTVTANIRIGRPGATDAEVLAAGRRAGVDEFADAIGWDTVLGSGGGRLSGGQRQRISIARALLADAPIVVLDEATAFLDAENEAATTAAVRELARGRTVLVVAHRLDTVTDADTVVLLEHGRVLDHGPHDDLLDRSPRYRQLWTAYRDTQGWTLDPTGDAPPAVPPPPPAGAPDAWSAAAARIVVPGLGELPFHRQWIALMGRQWPVLLRRGLGRLVLEGLFRGAPVAAVYLILRAAVEGSATRGLVWTVTAALALLLVARVFANNAANQVVWAASNAAKADLQLSMLDRLRRVPLGALRRFDAGRVSTVVNNDTVMLDFQNTPQQVAGATVAPVYAAVALLVLDWRLALATLAGIPLFLLLTVWSDAVHRRVTAPIGEARTVATARLLDQIRGTAVLRANPGSAQAGRYRAAVEDLRRASVDVSVRATPAVALASVALELGLVVLIVVGTGLFTAGSVGAPTLLLFLVLSLVLFQPLSELGSLAGYRRTQQQIAHRIGEIWDAPVLPEPTAPLPARDGSVELRDVGFRYGDSDAGLVGVSFTAAPGTVTALVGPSGAGKTTVANLVARFWDVDTGSVLIGGVDVRELGSAGVREAVTTVHQDVYLFPGSIRFNVTLGRPDATDAEVAAALDAAQCTDFVDALPDGVDSVVGDGGVDLSGGQRQRLSIARALLKDSPVLVLDEAVASVDAETEVRIQRALSRLVRGRTVIVVAHRLSTVRGADRIVVLDGGRLDGTGTHDELLETSPTYRRLWHAALPERQDA